MKKTILLLMLSLCINGFSQNNYFKQRENTHRLMTYNIHHARGMDNVVNTERIGKLILEINPEVVALQEVDSVAARSGSINTMADLADQTGMYASFSASIPLEGGKYGNGMLTKEKPLSSHKISLLGASEARSALVVELDKYVVICTHLSLSEEEQAQSVALLSAEADKYSKPVFLLGDLNAHPQSEVMKAFSTDWQVLSNPREMTFPSEKPEETLDYVLGYKPKGQTYAKFQSRVINEPVASDHRPLFVDVRLKTEASKVMRTIPYLQNPGTNEMTVMWMTNVPCRSWVEYGTDPNNLKRARTFLEGEMVANNTINRIHLTDLKAGTKYYYRAVSQEITRYSSYYKEFGDTIKTELKSFTTLDDNMEDIRVIVYNDIHSNMKMFDTLHSYVENKPYDLVIFNGDCFDDLEDIDRDIVDRLNVYTKRYKSDEVPSIIMRGNHETRGEYSGLLWDYLGRMNGRSYSAFNLGDTRFVLLDCGEDKPDDHWVYYDMNDFTQHRKDQAEFLKQEASSKEFKSANKRVLIHHIPIYGQDKYVLEYNPCGELWKPILEKMPFNVSLNAHTHKYEFIKKGGETNTFPVVIGGGNRDETGTVMILEKVGAKMSLQVLNIKGETILDLDL